MEMRRKEGQRPRGKAHSFRLRTSQPLTLLFTNALLDKTACLPKGILFNEAFASISYARVLTRTAQSFTSNMPLSWLSSFVQYLSLISYYSRIHSRLSESKITKPAE